MISGNATPRQHTSIRRLAILLPTLAGGGMERVSVNLLNEWWRRGIEVDLVVSRFDGPLCDLVPSDVFVFEAASRHPALFPFGLLRYTRQRRPSHILSIAHDIGAFTLIVTKYFRPAIPVVLTVHTHLSSKRALGSRFHRAKWRVIMWVLRRVIHRCRGLVAVSQGVADDLKKYLPLDTAKLHVVYNSIVTPQTQASMACPPTFNPVPAGAKTVLFVGRFVQAKGIDVLANAFAHISQKTDAHLVVLGDGPLKSDIFAWIEACALHDRIHMAGFQANPLPWMREADVLALPSRHEGLPTVLVEALACGTQIVAADCTSGPAEILDGGRFGQLVPVEDADALANALLRSLEEDFYVPESDLRRRAAVFASERIARRYEAILMGIPDAAETRAT